KPALVPLALAPEDLAAHAGLAGVSVEVEASCAGARFREAMLFTHRGISGPAILQVSSYWQRADAAEPIVIDLLPGIEGREWVAPHRRSRATPAAVLGERLPRRLAQQWCADHGFASPLAEMSDRDVAALLQAVKTWPLRPSGTLGYNKAEVTLGGVDTRGLSSRSLEALAVPGLYFIGEAVDVTGHLGGFNFQWAWSSAHAAGEAA